MDKMTNHWWAGEFSGQGADGRSSGAGTAQGFNQELTLPNNSAPGAGDRAATHESADHSAETREGLTTVPGARRHRGRPQGSKNKPKPPVFVIRDHSETLHFRLLKIAEGADVVDSIAQFARSRTWGVCVLSGFGAVANVALRQPSAPGAAIVLPGRYEILSLAGTFLPDPSLPGNTGLTLYLAGGQGQTIGGRVVGPLEAAGPVTVAASTFANVTHVRLPLEEEKEVVSAADAPEPTSGGGVALPIFSNWAHSGGQLGHGALSLAHARPSS